MKYSYTTYIHKTIIWYKTRGLMVNLRFSYCTSNCQEWLNYLKKYSKGFEIYFLLWVEMRYQSSRQWGFTVFWYVSLLGITCFGMEFCLRLSRGYWESWTRIKQCKNICFIPPMSSKSLKTNSIITLYWDFYWTIFHSLWHISQTPNSQSGIVHFVVWNLKFWNEWYMRMYGNYNATILLFAEKGKCM